MDALRAAALTSGVHGGDRVKEPAPTEHPECQSGTPHNAHTNVARQAPSGASYRHVRVHGRDSNGQSVRGATSDDGS